MHLHRCVRLVCTRQVHELASLRHVSLLPEKKRLGLMYPFSGLEAHLSRQVDKTRFQLFQPDLEALKLAERLFTPSPKHQIVYSSSAVRIDHMPELTQPEVRDKTRLFNLFKQNSTQKHIKLVYKKIQLILMRLGIPVLLCWLLLYVVVVVVKINSSVMQTLTSYSNF